MALDPASIAIEAVIAILSIVGSAAVGDVQQKSAEKRASDETSVRRLFQAARDSLGVTSDQLDQAMSKLDLKYSQLQDVRRGSARNSTASKIYRKFISTYPEKVNEINKLKNTISKGLRDLSAYENQNAAIIQNRGKVSGRTVASQIAGVTGGINTALSSSSVVKKPNNEQGNINTELNNNNNSDQTKEEVSYGDDTPSLEDNWVHKTIDRDNYRVKTDNKGKPLIK